MKRAIVLSVVAWVALCSVPCTAQQPFTLEQILSAPFVSDLIASKTGNRLAWSVNEQGRRNIWGAEGPVFVGRQLTAYNEDDGGELAELSFTPDGNANLVTKAGDHAYLS